MKHGFTAAVFALFVSVLTSCFLVNTDSGMTRVMFGQMQSFPADVTALHAAVYEETTQDSNLLEYQVFYPGSSVALYVPAGPSRIFVFWGETAKGTAGYYGTAGPLNVESGGNMRLPVVVQKIDNSIFNIAYNSNINIATWKSVAGASLYELQYQYNIGTTFVDLVWKTVFIGNDVKFSGAPPAYLDTVRIRASSSVFNLTTEYVQIP